MISFGWGSNNQFLRKQDYIRNQGHKNEKKRLRLGKSKVLVFIIIFLTKLRRFVLSFFPFICPHLLKPSPLPSVVWLLPFTSNISPQNKRHINRQCHLNLTGNRSSFQFKSLVIWCKLLISQILHILDSRNTYSSSAEERNFRNFVRICFLLTLI